MNFNMIVIKIIIISILYAVILTTFCKSVDKHWVYLIKNDHQEESDIEIEKVITFFDSICYSLSNMLLMSPNNLIPISASARIITCTMPIVLIYIIVNTDTVNVLNILKTE